MSDEIIAAARTTVPITSATLEKVVCHIQSSQVKSCQSVRVPLLFVYGVEQSMRRFIQVRSVTVLPSCVYMLAYFCRNLSQCLLLATISTK